LIADNCAIYAPEKKQSQWRFHRENEFKNQDNLTVAAQSHGKGIGELPLHEELNLISKYFLKPSKA
jgi:hypothetical protein